VNPAFAAEPLESRQLLAASVWHVAGDDAGDDKGDRIIVEPTPGQWRVIRAVVNGRVVASREITQFSRLEIRAKAGNDLVMVRLGQRYRDLRVRAFGGLGDDVLIGGANIDELVGNGGDDHIDGRGGSNMLHGGFGFDKIAGPERDVSDVREARVDRTRRTRVVPPVPTPEPPVVVPPPQVPSELADGINRFAFAFYRKLVEQTPDANLLFSPLSLVTALSLLLPASRGQTREQLLSALRSSSPPCASPPTPPPSSTSSNDSTPPPPPARLTP
jgi:hypothetical protein